MVSSIFDGWLWGLPFVVVLGRRRRGCRASWGVAATLKVGAFRGRRVGGVYGPFLARPAPSALQGQGRWAFDFRACPGVGRRGRGVRRGVGAVLAFAS